jgi:hypothetical protein
VIMQEGIAPLTSFCKRLHTLAIVVNAMGGSEQILNSRKVSSRSLFRLHVGHSHLKDPLQVAILLSHLAPNMDNLKWLQERTRSGSLDSNTGGWQKVCEFLPYLQNVRLDERRLAAAERVIAPQRSEKGVDATVITSSSGVQAIPETAESSIQFAPMLIDQEIDAVAKTEDVYIDATPVLVDAGISAVPIFVEESIEAYPSTMSRAVGTFVSTASKYVETVIEPLTLLEESHTAPPPSPSSHFADLPFISSIRDVVSFPFRVVRALRFLLSSRSCNPNDERSRRQDESGVQEKTDAPNSPVKTGSSNKRSSDVGGDGGMKSTSLVGRL